MDKNISFGRLFSYWILFFIFGLILIEIVTPISKSFIESEKEIAIESCKTINQILALLAPLTETFIFMFLPFWIFKKKGLKLGIIVWAFLHLFTKNFPIFLYICVMGFFYYKCLKIKKWKEVIFFHLIVNIIGVIACFL